MFRFLGRLIERTRGSGIAQPSCDNGFEVRKEGFIGCLQTESDYRRQHDTGQGGFFAAGAGMKNELMLVGAMPAGSHAAAGIAPGTCGPNRDGETYELTGKRDPETSGARESALRLRARRV
jgi:hypothetical protein